MKIFVTPSGRRCELTVVRNGLTGSIGVSPVRRESRGRLCYLALVAGLHNVRQVFILLFLLTAFSACENVDLQLYDQISFKVQEYPRNSLPEGSVPIFGKNKNYEDVEGSTLEMPFVLTGENAAKGEKLFGIFCGVCHGEKGRGDAPAAEKMDLEPYDLTEDNIKELTDGEIFVKILASDGVMPKYRNELTDMEAWEITAYVRRLQNRI